MIAARHSMLLGGGIAGAALGAPRQAWAGARRMAPFPPTNTLCEWPRRGRAGGLSLRHSYRAQRRCAVDWPHFGQNRQRSDGARRNGGDRPLRRGAGRRRAPGHDPLHLGRTLSHVHERYSFAWHRPVGLRGLDRRTRSEARQIVPTSRQVADAAPFAAIAITGEVLPAEALALFPK